MYSSRSLNGRLYCPCLCSIIPGEGKGLCLFHSTAMADPEEKKGDRDKAIDAVKKDKKAFLEGLIPKMFAPANVGKNEGLRGKGAVHCYEHS